MIRETNIVISKSSIKKLMSTSMGLALAQGINFLLIPILSRLYTPEDIGYWAQFFVISTSIGILSTLRYTDALVLTKDNEIKPLLTLCLTLSVIVSTLSFIILPYFVSASHHSNHSYFLMVSLTILFNATNLICLSLNIKNANFKTFSLLSALNSLLPVLFQLMNALFFNFQFSIVASGFIGYSLSFLTLFIVLVINLRKYRNYQSLKMGQVAKTYERYPKYSLTFSIFSLLRTKSMYFLLAGKNFSGFLGKYTQVEKVFNAPTTMLGAAIRPILFNTGATKDLRAYKDKFEIILFALIIIPAPILAFIYIYSEFLGVTLFGKQWSGVGLYIQCLIFPLFLNFCTNWLDRLYDIYSAQKQNLIFELIFGTISIVFVYMMMVGQISHTQLLTGLAITFSGFYLIWTSYILTKLSFNKLWFIKNVIISALVFFVFYSLYLSLYNSATNHMLINLAASLAGSILILGFLYKRIRKQT